MGWVWTLATTAALALAIAPVTASAEADSEYVREGAYVSLAGVFALENTSGRFSNLDNTGGAQLRAGYRMAPVVALELFGEWLHFDGENPAALGVAAKLYPVEMFNTSLLGGILQPYVIGTAGFSWVDNRRGETDAGGDFRAGGGLDIYVLENLFLFTEVHYAGKGGVPEGLRSTNFLAGAGFRF